MSTMPRSRRVPLVAVLLCAAACAHAAAQPPTAPEADPDGVGIKVSFRPSVLIVVGIFTMIFSLTFILLMYAKFCHPSSVPAAAAAHQHDRGLPLAGGVPAAAGVAKAVVESLPFFRFAALRGARQGLECAVCLARFDDADLLRLLPRCRHAFHLACVDRWLDANATCPLCRTRVDADDAALGLKYAACSARFVFGGSDRFDDHHDNAPGRDLLDIFVERAPSSRFPTNSNDDELVDDISNATELDRHKHRIIVSDVVFKSRWSEINPADLIALDTEMLRSMSSARFPSFRFPDDKQPPAASILLTDDEQEETKDKKRLLPMERKSSAAAGGCCSSSAAVDAEQPKPSSSGMRSMSEIVSLPRLRAAVRDRLSEEDRARRRWVPIARRTARWFAGRERRYVKGDDEEEVDAAAHV